MNGKVGDLRPSQLITTFGPGAIMDLPDMSVIIAGIDRWDTKLCHRIDEPRLIKKLGVKRLLSPPISDNDTNQGTLPAFRFPRYLVCPECRRLAPASQFMIDDKQVATCACRTGDPPRAFPVRFVVVCPRGHVSDFPWIAYVHRGRTDCAGRHLRLIERGLSGSIADVEVVCDDCGAVRKMNEAFGDPKPEVLGTCPGERPWLRDGTEHCDERAPHLRVVLRGASNVYFPTVVSALSIPPFTDPVHEAISAVFDRMAKVDSPEKLHQFLEVGSYEELDGLDEAEIWLALQQQRKLPSGESADLMYPEWQALTGGAAPGGKMEFETEPQQVPQLFKGLLSRLVMVKRLIEVRALTGFTRIDPPPDTTDLVLDDDTVSVVSRRAHLSKSRLGWLPALETRGEGVFFALDFAALHKWENKASVQSVATAMAHALERYCDDRSIPRETRPAFPGARYVLLHTLSHVLMRQLCVESGYSATSLRERIYCRTNPDEEMAGVLIYTATPDSEGSLGGLVELGRTDRFSDSLYRALQEARLCSADPLCAEHEPEAVGDLNGAACHACCLAPETSCEHSNRFLDRSFLIPTVSGSDRAFFVSGG